MERLPFTDENLEDEAYREECDRLAALEIAQEHTSWGRWFISDGMLSTWVVAPSHERQPVRKLYVYDFSIERCRTKSGQVEILQQMEDKTWLGGRGIKDLKRAMKYLSKKGVEVDDNGI